MDKKSFKCPALPSDVHRTAAILRWRLHFASSLHHVFSYWSKAFSVTVALTGCKPGLAVGEHDLLV